MKLRHAVAAWFVLQLVVGVSAAEAQGRRNRNLITQEEIEKSSATDAYQLIKTLRPGWFTRRGVSSGQVRTDAVGGLDDGTVMVAYLDGVRMSDVNDLSSLTVERIKEVRYLNASDATTKYGTGHTSGAIEITSKR